MDKKQTCGYETQFLTLQGVQNILPDLKVQDLFLDSVFHRYNNNKGMYVYVLKCASTFQDLLMSTQTPSPPFDTITKTNVKKKKGIGQYLIYTKVKKTCLFETCSMMH